MLSNIGSTELILIILALVVVLGANKVAQLGRSLGETSKELKKVKKEYETALKDDPKDNDAPDQEGDDNKEEV